MTITIDEAIVHEQNRAEDLRHHYNPLVHLEAEEHEQIARWLNDYKRLKESIAFMSNRPIEDIYFEAYNKGVNDCSKKLVDMVPVHKQDILQIAEQLKKCEKLITKADGIRSMSDEKLAEFLPIVSSFICTPTETCMKNIFNRGECENTKECALKWLQSEVEEQHEM